jgi:pilus assembly protein CpaD
MMNLHSRRLTVVAGLLLLALAACRPGAAEYTDLESPKTVKVSDASVNLAVRFVRGTTRLLPADAARLQALAASGQIAPADRVTVSAAGTPALATARVETIADNLVRYGIVASEGSLAAIPPDQAIIATGRYLVTTPPCPNWSKNPALDFTNTYDSNFGCADAVNLGRMVWRPADLAQGVPLGPVYTEGPGLVQSSSVINPQAQLVPAVTAGSGYYASTNGIGSALSTVGCAVALATPSATSNSGITIPTNPVAPCAVSSLP